MSTPRLDTQMAGAGTDTPMPPAPPAPTAEQLRRGPVPVRAGPKDHPVITATNRRVFESSTWKRFLLRRDPPRGYTKREDHFFFSPLTFSYAWSREHGMELRAFGTTREGFSMCVRVLNFPPYFFARLPDAMRRHTRAETERLLREYAGHLNTHLRNTMRDWERKRLMHTPRLVHASAVRAEEHFPTMVFSGKQTAQFARIFVAHPSVVRTARTACEFPYGGVDKTGREQAPFLPEAFLEQGVPEEGFAPYEADVDYVVRFLADTGLSPSTWWRVSSRVTEVEGDMRASTANLEVVASPEMLSAEVPDEVAATVAPYVRAKFDIEVETSERFPQPETSRVIQVSVRMSLGDAKPGDARCMVTEPMREDEYARPGRTVNITLCLGSVRPRPGFVPIVFDTEEELLWAWYELVPVLGIDDIAGHFSDGFDFWYLLERAKALGLKNFKFLGRVPYETAYSNVDVERERRQAASKAKFKQRQKEQYMTRVPGVCVWDFLFYAVAFQRSATSFGLNALAAQFLQDKQKLDVEYALIARMQQSEDGRTQLAEYCDRDVLLVQLLDEKVGASAFLRELADLSFVPRQQLLNRASVFRAVARWMYEAQRYDKSGRRYLMPSKSARKVPSRAQVVAAVERLRQTLLPGAKPPKATAEEKKAGKYNGGTVIEPCPGFYEDLVLVFDFMSLYPALMQLHNICYTTILPPGQQDVLMAQHGLTEEDVWHAPVYELRPDGETTRPRICKATMPSFVRAKCMEGILPYVERTLAILRKKKKATMDDAYRTLNAETPDNVITPERRAMLLSLARICNNQQLCIKIFMNSLYGVMGAAEATFPLRDGARTVTSEARQAIEVARYNAETHFETYKVEVPDGWRKITELAGDHTHEAVQRFIREFNARKPEEGLPFVPEVVYGDSVPGDCPVVVRTVATGELMVVPIESLWDDAAAGAWHGEKEAMKPTNTIEVLVDGGFTPVQQIVRHRTDKPLMETRTATGVVLTTKDHALIRADLTPAPPSELRPGDVLATAPVRAAMLVCAAEDGASSEAQQHAWLLGFCFAHVDAEPPNEQSLFSNTNITLRFRTSMQSANEICQLLANKFGGTQVHRKTARDAHPHPAHTVTIQPNPPREWCYGVARARAMLDNNIFFELNGHTMRRVPDDVLTWPATMQKQFLIGMTHCSAGTMRAREEKNRMVVVHGAVAAQGVYLLLRRFNAHVAVERHYREEVRGDRIEGVDKYVLRTGEAAVPGTVVSARRTVHVAEHCAYVYDLVTDKQRFCAGVGDTVVHNTDSIFVRCRFFVGDNPAMSPIERAQRAEKYAVHMSRELSRFYGPPMCLQYEKAFARFFLVGKKNYMGRRVLFEGGKYSVKDTSTGTCDVRRDGCALKRRLCTDIRAALLEHGSPEKAVEVARAALAYVLSGKATHDEVLMCATVSRPIADYAKPGPPHVELARKMMADGERPFNKGDRVYFIVVGGSKGDGIRDRVRTPQDVVENDIPYCVEYYGLNVIMEQAKILLGPLVDPRAYEEKRAFQRWARVTGFEPDGKERIRKAKDEFRAAQQRIVTQLVLHGLSLEATRRLEQATIGDTFAADTDAGEPLSDAEADADAGLGLPESGDEQASESSEPESDAEPDAEEDGAPGCSTPRGAGGAARAAGTAAPASAHPKRAREEDDPDGAPASKRARAEGAPEPEPPKRARPEGAPEGEPAAKRGRAEASPFFGACFKKAAGGGISAAFKATGSVGTAARRTLVKGGVPKSSPLFKAVVVYDRCVGCDATVSSARGFICAACEEKRPELRREQLAVQLAKTNALEKEHAARWNTCTTCRGHAMPAQDKAQCTITHCINYGCPNWGRRQVVTRDLRKAHERMSKLGLEHWEWK